MDITFLIGNGFDIGIGLKTSYKNFYPYFIEKADSTNMIMNKIKEDKDEWENFDRWADLEIALGKYTESIDMNNYEKFIKDKLELDMLLIEYLKQEEKTAQSNKALTSEMLKNAVIRLKKWEVIKEQEKVSGIFKKYQNESIRYNAISFNYTNCIEKIFKEKEKIGTHRVGNTIYDETIGDTLYLHGTLYNHEMILGVNDEEQIANKELIRDTDIDEIMIKPKINDLIGQNKSNRAKDIINNSKVICIYGMSIGDTDRIWWEHIGKWLCKDEARLLIIFNYDRDYTPSHQYIVRQHQNMIKERFISNANMQKLEEPVLKNIKEKILIKENENIFSLSNK